MVNYDLNYILKATAYGLQYNTSAILNFAKTEDGNWEYEAARIDLIRKGFTLTLDYVRDNGDLQVSWKRNEKEYYDIRRYVRESKDTMISLIVDFLNDNDLTEKYKTDFENEEIESLENFVNDNNGDYWEMLNNASPEIIYNYDVCRVFAENYNEVSGFYEDFGGGDIIDSMRYAISQAITDDVGDLSCEVYEELCKEEEEAEKTSSGGLL